MSGEEIIESPSDEKISAVLCGVSGEYFVAAELSRRGYIASITLRNSRGVDILASNADASRTVAIQVKTNQGSKREWLMANKAEGFHSPNHFYVFVRLNGPKGAPEYFVVPSQIVSEQVTNSHAAWLGTPGKNGRPHQDNPVRRFSDLDGVYLNRWDQLKL